jgi:hypothetical protein
LYFRLSSSKNSEKAIEHKNDTNQINPNIKWDKVDQDLYIAMINEGVKKISKQPVVTQEDTFSQLVTAGVQISGRPVAHGNQNVTWVT